MLSFAILGCTPADADCWPLLPSYYDQTSGRGGGGSAGQKHHRRGASQQQASGTVYSMIIDDLRLGSPNGNDADDDEALAQSCVRGYVACAVFVIPFAVASFDSCRCRRFRRIMLHIIFFVVEIAVCLVSALW
jgi:hypothetical protein